MAVNWGEGSNSYWKSFTITALFEMSEKALWKVTVFVSVSICDALRDLISFVQFKKREKHPWRSVNFSKVAGWSVQLY